MSRYHELLEQLRKAFPAPVSDPVHDGYVVFSMMRALDQVDALKTDAPLLGRPTDPDYAAAEQGELARTGKTTEEVIPELVKNLEGMLIWGHPRCQVNVASMPSIASIIGVLLPSMYNPNLCSEESGFGFSAAEVRVAAMISRLVGYEVEKARGLFTFGGTGALLYGIKIGLEKAAPDSFRRGLDRPVVILCSAQSHYACLNVAGWTGIGQERVIKVATHSDNSIKLPELEQAARTAIEAGNRIAAIVATMGTTDAFGIDDLAAVRKLRDRLVEEYSLDYRPHLHADSVIGWAWSTYNDYDFTANRLGFRGRTLRALAAAQHRIRHLKLADSLGVDFHKTGFAPYISSMFLVRDRDDLRHIARDRTTMPYLFHSGEYHPGMYTLETSRPGTGPMAALASLLLLGKEGLAVLLGHLVEMAELLREDVAARPELSILNGENVGPVSLIRAYPDDVETFDAQQSEFHDETFRPRVAEINTLNRRIFQRVHEDALDGHGVAIGLTECYRQTDFGDPIVALKSYVISPFADAGQMRTVVEHILRAREAVLSESATDPLPPSP